MVGSVVKANVGDIEDNTREWRIRMTRKDVLGCVQAVARNKKFLFKFEDGQKKYISYFLLSYVCSKEEACLEIDGPISDLQKRTR